MAADALSDVLKTVRLTGAAYFDIAAQEPWSVHSPARDLILPRILPGADHLIAYHVVTAGRCFASLDGGEAVPLEAGEVVMFTNADPHVMSSSAGLRADPPTADMIDIAEAGHLPFHINLMNGGAVSAQLVCGYLACDSRPFNPLLEALPPMLKAGDPRKNDAGWLGQFIHFAVAEVGQARRQRKRPHQAQRVDVHRRGAALYRDIAAAGYRLACGLARSHRRQGIGVNPCTAFIQLDHRGTGATMRSLALGAG